MHQFFFKQADVLKLKVSTLEESHFAVFFVRTLKSGSGWSFNFEKLELYQYTNIISTTIEMTFYLTSLSDSDISNESKVNCDVDSSSIFDK